MPMFSPGATPQPGATGTSTKASSMVLIAIDRREQEGRLVHEGRHPVFLEEDLDHVGHHLQQTEGADAIGPIAVLPQA